MDERELVLRCMRRDFGAFELIYQRYMPMALRTSWLVTRSKPEAEDAVQEAFIQVWRRIDTLRDVAAFRAWFYRILLNTTHHQGRKSSAAVTVPLDLNEYDQPDVNSATPVEQVEHGEELHQLRIAISALPDMHRVPLVLRYYSRLSDAEIADVLAIPVGTVNSQ